MNTEEAFGTPERFTNPDEEIQYLRERLDAVENRERERGHTPDTSVVREALRDDVRVYQQEPTERVLADEVAMDQREVADISLNLSPEQHDKQMHELIALVQEKGVKNALAVVAQMDNPHLEDDFHRFLVEYLREGYPVTDLKQKESLRRALHHTLFEVILPGEREGNENQRPLREVLGSMEQLYMGLISLADKDNVGQPYFAIELGLPADSAQYSFYASIPNDKLTLFEKQVTAIYPDAQVIQQNDDYNPFNSDGVVVGSRGSCRDTPLYPIRTYDTFEYDPLNVILNSLSHISDSEEGAAIQLILSPDSDQGTFKRFKRAREAIGQGVPVKEAVARAEGGAIGEFSSDMRKGLKEFMFGASQKEQEGPNEKARELQEQIGVKIKSPLIHTNIRLLASSKDEARARTILDEMESAFKQFENTEGNTIVFERLQGKQLDKLIKDYTFRLFEPKTAFALNTAELTSILHFERLGVTHAHGLKETSSSVAPPPTNLSHEGLVLGYNAYRGTETTVHMAEQDRLRHFYTIGQTGTGKTSLLKNMIIQDIQNGEGVCMIDPHGVDVQDVLGAIPEERMQDVIYFDPADTSRPMGLNMLEYDTSHPELKTFVINELFSIFQKLYANVPESMGPMFEQYFRNATALVIEDPDSGNTLLDISRLLANAEYRALKLSKCTNPVVVQFWEEIAGKAGGEASLQNIVPYITSKFDVFLSNEIMRPIIAQEKSAFNFREIMDHRKILLVNLSKGKLGDMNAHLLGMILVGKILMASLARGDSEGGNFPPFYLYIDEFQNFTTDSIATILSEARKYKLSLHLAHQFIAQLDESIKDAVFGNVGTMSAFRVGSEDAQFLETYFEPTFAASDLMNVNNHQAHLRLLVGGQPTKPFTLFTHKPVDRDAGRAQTMRDYSRTRYGEDRDTVEARIMEKYRSMQKPVDNGAHEA